MICEKGSLGKIFVKLDYFVSFILNFKIVSVLLCLKWIAVYFLFLLRGISTKISQRKVFLKSFLSLLVIDERPFVVIFSTRVL